MGISWEYLKNNPYLGDRLGAAWRSETLYSKVSWKTGSA